MSSKPTSFIRIVVLSMLALLSCFSSMAVDHSHASLAIVLSNRIRNGAVDYGTLKKHPGELDRYLDSTAQVTAAEFEGWTKPQQLAFLINLYNAATLKLVADHYPVTSIKKIGGFFGSPWKQKCVRLWGEVVTLEHLEHVLIRARYQEPRIHFALVYAAKGCPELRSEPFIAERLDLQLDDQGQKFLRNPSKNRLDAATQTVWLSPIFKWFKDDFTADGDTLIQFVQPFFDEADSKALGSGTWKIQYTDYDWSLNGR